MTDLVRFSFLKKQNPKSPIDMENGLKGDETEEEPAFTRAVPA